MVLRLLHPRPFLTTLNYLVRSTGVRENRRMSGRAKKLILIGWDAADWRVINPLLDAGKLPHLQRLVEGGSIGNIATIEPMLSPMLWTSIATGKRAYKHGVLGFSEIDPVSGTVRPVTTLGRKTKAIWNILCQEGLRCNLVGWWPSHPVEPINGVMVSNEFQSAAPPLGESWTLPVDSVHPERLREAVADLRLHPQEVTHELIGPFVPRWREIDRQKDDRIDALGKILAECASVHAVATAVMQLEPWDFMGIYYNAIDSFCHHFMPFHPPHCPGVSERDFELYQHVVERAYQYHDLMLGTLMQLSGEEAAIMLVSDHGFHSDEARKRLLPDEPAAIAHDHRRFGMFAMRGPAIKKDERIYGASVLDITPTILQYFNLPVGEDMDGKPLLDLFNATPAIRFIKSWDLVQGRDGSHAGGGRIDTLFAAASLKNLASMGYLETLNDKSSFVIDKTTTELEYNLARAYMDGREYASAARILAKLFEKNPHQYRFGIQLAYCFKALNEPRTLKDLVDTMIARRTEEARQARRELDAIQETSGLRDTAELESTRKRQIQTLQRKASTNFYTLEFLLGYAEMALGNSRGAIEHFARARRTDSARPELYLQLGQAYLELRQWSEAEECFRISLGLDEDLAPAHTGLCRCYLARREYYRAVNSALASVGLIYFNPYAHFLLGIALQGFGSYFEAESAFRVAIHQEPRFPAAHRCLARLYEKYLKNESKANVHRKLSRDGFSMEGWGDPNAPESGVARIISPAKQDPFPFRNLRAQNGHPENVITIVSGLPRSGTSLMMQMLAATGIPILADHLRSADENNPKGFFEFEKVKLLPRDSSWLSEARGKCLKIVAPLLSFLPENFSYRVILMRRPLAEIAASQCLMIARKRGDPLGSASEILATIEHQWIQALNFLENRRIPSIVIDYHQCLDSCDTVCDALDAFLGLRVNRQQMAGCVDRQLYRSREGATLDP